MKEKLVERMKLIEDAIARQQKAVEQAIADFNALNGARQELAHIVNLMEQDELQENADPEKVCEVDRVSEPVPLDENAMCEAV